MKRNPYKEKGRVPLRVNKTTVVLVPPERATEEYAAQLRERYGKAQGIHMPAKYIGDYA